MGRRRRRIVKVVKKKLPTVFACPKCGEDAVKVTITKETGLAAVHCAACGLKDEFEATRAAHTVDIYCKFTDKFYAASKARQVQADAAVAPQ